MCVAAVLVRSITQSHAVYGLETSVSIHAPVGASNEIRFESSMESWIRPVQPSLKLIGLGLN